MTGWPHGRRTSRTQTDEFGQVAAAANPGYQPYRFQGGLLDKPGTRSISPTPAAWDPANPSAAQGQSWVAQDYYQGQADAAFAEHYINKAANAGPVPGLQQAAMSNGYGGYGGCK